MCTPWNSPSAVYRSTDGVAWTKYANIGDTGGHLYLNYRGGKFVAYGDNKTSFQSTDALTWTVMSGIEEATYCDDTWKSQADCKDSSWFDGAYLRADWQGKISRSTNGTSFTTAYNDDQKNTLVSESSDRGGVRRAEVAGGRWRSITPSPRCSATASWPPAWGRRSP